MFTEGMYVGPPHRTHEPQTESSAAPTEPVEAKDVVAPIHHLIKRVQERAAPDGECRFRQALAHLWAAADLLESAPPVVPSRDA